MPADAISRARQAVLRSLERSAKVSAADIAELRSDLGRRSALLAAVKTAGKRDVWLMPKDYDDLRKLTRMLDDDELTAAFLRLQH